MFMIEKSLILIMFVYCCSFCLIGAQYIWADVFHITMTNLQGQPLKNNLIKDINTSTLNKEGTSILNNTSSNAASGVIFAAEIGWDLILLISGLSVFDLAYQLGVPIIFVMGFAGLYLFLLARSIMGFVRGI